MTYSQTAHHLVAYVGVGSVLHSMKGKLNRALLLLLALHHHTLKNFFLSQDCASIILLLRNATT